MARTIIFSAVLFLAALSSAANAQCLTCKAEQQGSAYGHCDYMPSNEFMCTRTCCANQVGADCRMMDFKDPCFNGLSGPFQIAMFTEHLPGPQIVPDCRMTRLRRQEAGINRVGAPLTTESVF